MDDEVGVAADGAGEMRVAAERQAEMAVIFGAVIGLRLGAEDLLHDLRLEIRLPDPLDDAVESGGPDHLAERDLDLGGLEINLERDQLFAARRFLIAVNDRDRKSTRLNSRNS